MNWSYAELRAADAALAIADPARAAEALKAASVATPRIDVPILTITSYLRRLVRDDGKSAWINIREAVETIPAAAALVEMNDDQRVLTLDPGDAVVASIFQILVKYGILSDVELANMWPTVPKWDPPPSEHDIAYARKL